MVDPMQLSLKESSGCEWTLSEMVVKVLRFSEMFMCCVGQTAQRLQECGSQK